LLSNRAVLLAATGRPAAALELACQAAAIDDRMIGQVFAISSDRQRLAYLKLFQVQLELFLSLVTRHLPDSPEAIEAAFDLVLRRKALGAEALAAQRDAVFGGRYPHLQAPLVQLTQLRNQIVQTTLAGPAVAGNPGAYRQLLDRLIAERERLEQELARQIPEMNLEKQLRAADRRAVAFALPEGVALVEFVRFDVLDFHALPARGERPWQLARYLAFVLPGGGDNVLMKDLGEAGPIDQMIADFRAGVSVPPENRPRSMLPVAGDGAPPSTPAVPALPEGTRLRQAIFDPLRQMLGDRTRLRLAPDGELTRLPFEVLPGQSAGERLIDTHEISYLTTGRDVLRFGAAGTALAPGEPVIAGDPDFDLGATADEKPAECGRCSRDLDRSRGCERLPGTRLEAQGIADRLGVVPWLAERVLEAKLKQVRSPRILHLSTHGFFLPNQEPAPDQRALDLGGGRAERLAGTSLENPLLRSGLILAGYNTWRTGGRLPPEAEDGMLTAEDVAGLDLLATELVVLSACDTGLGEVQVGEGVFGLRRAFVVAGAKTLVMSLWKVPDEQTQELMIDFYRRLLSGVPRAEALRQAQLQLKRRYPDPYYWGAFICQGEPTPLSPAQSRPLP
jgi:CHAT domain-containing protein